MGRFFRSIHFSPGYFRYSLKLKILCDDSFDSSQNCAIFRVFGQTVGFSVKYANLRGLLALKTSILGRFYPFLTAVRCYARLTKQSGEELFAEQFSEQIPDSMRFAFTVFQLCRFRIELAKK